MKTNRKKTQEIYYTREYILYTMTPSILDKLSTHHYATQIVVPSATSSSFCSSESNNSPRRRQKVVNFDSDTIQQYYIHLSRDEYSKSEIKNCWYTKSELKKRKKKDKKVLVRIESGHCKCKRNEPYRGLENRTEQGQRECKEQIHSCADAVMDEQEKQWEKGITDWERIAYCSRQVSIYCAIVASKRAIQDAKDAKKAYESMDRKEETELCDWHYSPKSIPIFTYSYGSSFLLSVHVVD